MLGPSLSRLCDLSSASDKRGCPAPATGAGQARNQSTMPGSDHGATLASTLCIAIHRTAVKSGAKALENLALAIKQDPFDGEQFRPGDARWLQLVRMRLGLCGWFRRLWLRIRVSRRGGHCHGILKLARRLETWNSSSGTLPCLSSPTSNERRPTTVATR